MRPQLNIKLCEVNGLRERGVVINYLYITLRVHEDDIFKTFLLISITEE